MGLDNISWDGIGLVGLGGGEGDVFGVGNVACDGDVNVFRRDSWALSQGLGASVDDVTEGLLCINP